MAFYFRHQAGGVIHDHPFDKKPTDNELAPLRKLMLERFGETHPKTGAPFWDRVEEYTGKLDKAGNPETVAYGHTEAMSGHPAPIDKKTHEEAEAARFRETVTAQGKGFIKNP